jgi:hypothetical protein
LQLGDTAEGGELYREEQRERQQRQRGRGNRLHHEKLGQKLRLWSGWIFKITFLVRIFFFCTFFWRATVCEPLLCLCRPFFWDMSGFELRELP